MTTTGHLFLFVVCLIASYVLVFGLVVAKLITQKTALLYIRLSMFIAIIVGLGRGLLSYFY